jgi:hypothetical protein
MTATPTPQICVDEYAAAKALGVSVGWLRKDRRTARIVPHFKMGTFVRYNLERVQESLAALERGGADAKARK